MPVPKELENLLKDLLIFYATENYKQYLIDHDIQKIFDEDLDRVVREMYIDKKKHVKNFLKDSLQEIMQDDYIGDLSLQNIFTEIFSDDNLACERIRLELVNIQSE